MSAAPAPLGRDAARALAVLREQGLLLVTDPRLPSLAALVAGGPVRGSWWGHPRGRAIFAAATQLDDHPEVACVKLVSGKLTFVHRRLWRDLVAVATAREPWQMRGLTAQARTLLARLEREGPLRADDAREAVRLLEGRLLAQVESVHTDSGAHAKVLRSWKGWARQRRVGRPPDPESARRRLEQAVAEMARASGGKARLPWQ